MLPLMHVSSSHYLSCMSPVSHYLSCMSPVSHYLSCMSFISLSCLSRSRSAKSLHVWTYTACLNCKTHKHKHNIAVPCLACRHSTLAVETHSMCIWPWAGLHSVAQRAASVRNCQTPAKFFTPISSLQTD